MPPTSEHAEHFTLHTSHLTLHTSHLTARQPAALPESQTLLHCTIPTSTRPARRRLPSSCNSPTPPAEDPHGTISRLVVLKPRAFRLPNPRPTVWSLTASFKFLSWTWNLIHLAATHHHRQPPYLRTFRANASHHFLPEPLSLALPLSIGIPLHSLHHSTNVMSRSTPL